MLKWYVLLVALFALPACPGASALGKACFQSAGKAAAKKSITGGAAIGASDDALRALRVARPLGDDAIRAADDPAAAGLGAEANGATQGAQKTVGGRIGREVAEEGTQQAFDHLTDDRD